MINQLYTPYILICMYFIIKIIEQKNIYAKYEENVVSNSKNSLVAVSIRVPGKEYTMRIHFPYPIFHVSLDLTGLRDANTELLGNLGVESVRIGLAVLAWSPLFKGTKVVETGPRTILLPIESSTCLQYNVVLIRGLAPSTKTEYYCLPFLLVFESLPFQTRISE